MKKLFVVFFALFQFYSMAQPWFEKSNFGGEARHRATSFSIGNHGYIGLGHINSVIGVEYEDFWKYDPSSDTWTQIANYPEGECFHATSFTIGNKGYVGTGRLSNGSYSKNFYSYEPELNTWTQIADLPGVERRGAIAFSINGKGYVGTGQTFSGNSNDFYEYNPLTDQWIVRASLPGLPRTSSVAFSIGNFGYLGTGDTNSGSSNDFYQYNPVTNQWVIKAPVGTFERQEATGFAVNGLGYIGSGDDYSSGNNYPDMWEYDPILNSWIQIEDFAGTPRRYLTSFVIGSRAYTGTGTSGTNFKDFWMFDQILSVLTRKMEYLTINTYPNPASENICIALKELPEFIQIENVTCSLFSATGKLISSTNFESSTCNIDVATLQNGQYIYQLNYEGNSFKKGKIIIAN